MTKDNEKYGIDDMKYIIMVLEDITEEEYERQQKEYFENTTPEEREERRQAARRIMGCFRKSNPLGLI